MDELLAKGIERHREIYGDEGTRWREEFGNAHPEAIDLLMKACFGSVYCRPGLDLRIRELCTVAALTVLGRWPQLKGHIGGALRVGCTKEQISELLLQMHVYGGWPVALTALDIAKEVFDESDLDK